VLATSTARTIACSHLDCQDEGVVCLTGVFGSRGG
jgi:hypothetical protein